MGTRSKPQSPHLFLLETQPAKPTAVPQEVILDGHRYRLVPLEGEGEGARESVAPPLQPSAPLRPPEVLTARELQVVALVADGRVNKQIAAELGISEWTVSTHLRRIYAKLDVDTRAAMVTRCYGGPALQGVPPSE